LLILPLFIINVKDNRLSKNQRIYQLHESTVLCSYS
jgi:hypothetical protein